MRVHLVLNDRSTPAGKLADAELHFDQADGALAGLKLCGFAVWQRRTGTERNVTFPARAYTVNGERRSFALLRPVGTYSTLRTDAQDAVRDAILRAYDEATAPALPRTAADAADLLYPLDPRD